MPTLSPDSDVGQVEVLSMSEGSFEVNYLKRSAGWKVALVRSSFVRHSISLAHDCEQPQGNCLAERDD